MEVNFLSLFLKLVRAVLLFQPLHSPLHVLRQSYSMNLVGPVLETFCRLNSFNKKHSKDINQSTPKHQPKHSKTKKHPPRFGGFDPPHPPHLLCPTTRMAGLLLPRGGYGGHHDVASVGLRSHVPWAPNEKGVDIFKKSFFLVSFFPVFFGFGVFFFCFWSGFTI